MTPVEEVMRKLAEAGQILGDAKAGRTVEAVEHIEMAQSAIYEAAYHVGRVRDMEEARRWSLSRTCRRP